MKFFGMGGFELVIILIVILLIFGPKNLPKLGNALGKTVSNLRSGMNEGKKKKEEAETSESDEAADAQEASAAQPAEIVGEVEDVKPAGETVEAGEAEEVVFDNSDGVEEVTFEDEVPVNEGEPAEASQEESAEPAADQPKKVRRVVKKKVVKTEDE